MIRIIGGGGGSLQPVVVDRVRLRLELSENERLRVMELAPLITDSGIYCGVVMTETIDYSLRRLHLTCSDGNYFLWEWNPSTALRHFFFLGTCRPLGLGDFKNATPASVPLSTDVVRLSTCRGSAEFLFVAKGTTYAGVSVIDAYRYPDIAPDSTPYQSFEIPLSENIDGPYQALKTTGCVSSLEITDMTDLHMCATLSIRYGYAYLLRTFLLGRDGDNIIFRLYDKSLNSHCAVTDGDIVEVSYEPYQTCNKRPESAVYVSYDGWGIRIHADGLGPVVPEGNVLEDLVDLKCRGTFEGHAVSVSEDDITITRYMIPLRCKEYM